MQIKSSLFNTRHDTIRIVHRILSFQKFFLPLNRIRCFNIVSYFIGLYIYILGYIRKKEKKRKSDDRTIGRNTRSREKFVSNYPRGISMV